MESPQEFSLENKYREFITKIEEEIAKSIKISDLETYIDQIADTENLEWSNIVDSRTTKKNAVHKIVNTYNSQKVLGRLLNKIHKENPKGFPSKKTKDTLANLGFFFEENTQAKQEINEDIDENKLKAAKENFYNTIRENIRDELKANKLKGLREHLAKNINSSSTDAKEVAEKLVACDPDNFISTFAMSVSKALKEAKDNEEDSHRIWEGAVNILGWLVRITVKYEWVYSKKDQFGNSESELFDDLTEQIKFKIPVETEAGLEMIFSSAVDCPANLDINEKTGHLYSPRARKYEFPESGPVPKDHVYEIKQTIKKIVGYKDDTIIHKDNPEENKKYNDNVLNGLLQFRNDQKDYCYLVFDSEQTEKSTQQIEKYLSVPGVYSQLKKDLPNLNILFMSVGPQQAFVVSSERGLMGMLIGFFKLKPR